jgi:hypothetical protein
VGALLHSRVKEVPHGIASQGTSTIHKIQDMIVSWQDYMKCVFGFRVIHVDCLPHSVKINAQYHSNLLHSDVHQVNQNKTFGNLSKLIRLHDNAHTHTENLSK